MHLREKPDIKILQANKIVMNVLINKHVNQGEQVNGQNAVKNQKQKIRKDFLSRRNRLASSESNFQEAPKQAAQHIASYFKEKSGFWGSYCPIHTEFNPLAIESENKHLTWVYPKIRRDSETNKIMEFLYPHQAIWQKNRWGIEEPLDHCSEVIAIEDLQGIFCPAIAVDLKGHRLGYGQGYYDRTLCGFKGEKIALVFSEQISKQILPQDKDDVVMDWILTESKFFRVHK